MNSHPRVSPIPGAYRPLIVKPSALQFQWEPEDAPPGGAAGPSSTVVAIPVEGIGVLFGSDFWSTPFVRPFLFPTLQLFPKVARKPVVLEAQNLTPSGSETRRWTFTLDPVMPSPSLLSPLCNDEFPFT